MRFYLRHRHILNVVGPGALRAAVWTSVGSPRCLTLCRATDAAKHNKLLWVRPSGVGHTHQSLNGAFKSFGMKHFGKSAFGIHITR